MDPTLSDLIIQAQIARSTLRSTDRLLIQNVFRVCPAGNLCVLITFDPDKINSDSSPESAMSWCISLKLLHPSTMEEANVPVEQLDPDTLQELTKIRKLLVLSQLPERDESLTKRFVDIMELKFSGEQHGQD